MAFRPENYEWDHSPWIAPLSEITRIPDLLHGSPPGCSPYRRDRDVWHPSGKLSILMTLGYSAGGGSSKHHSYQLRLGDNCSREIILFVYVNRIDFLLSSNIKRIKRVAWFWQVFRSHFVKSESRMQGYFLYKQLGVQCCTTLRTTAMDDFRVRFCLCFKASSCANPVMKIESPLKLQAEHIFIRIVSHES